MLGTLCAVILSLYWLSTNFYIQLNTPVKIGEFVRPICLPHGEIAPTDLTCVAIGFGVGKYSGQLETRLKDRKQIERP